MSNSKTPVDIQKSYYAATAVKYDDLHSGDMEHNIALEVANATIAKLGLRSILDVGCGTGRGVKYFLDQGMKVRGVEPVKELIEAGRKKYSIPPEVMIEAGGGALPFEDQSFNCSIELGVLHHVADPSEIVSEMIRVSRDVIFISDCNRFGQGSFLSRLVKLAAWKIGAWGAIDFIRTRGRGFTISEEDGLAYSYSIYDSFDQLADWADTISIIPTTTPTSGSWVHPLLTTSHALLIAERKPKS